MTDTTMAWPIIGCTILAAGCGTTSLEGDAGSDTVSPDPTDGTDAIDVHESPDPALDVPPDDPCLGESGLVVMGTPTQVASSEDVYSSVGIAWLGSRYGVLLTWADGLGLTRIDADGNPIGSTTTFPSGTGSLHAGSATWTGSAVAVAWERDWEVHLALLDGDGERIVPDTRLTHDPWWSASPSLTWTGSEIVVAWMDSRVMESECTMTSCYSDAFITRVGPDGTEIGDDVRISDTSRSGGWPGIAWVLWTGEELGVFWGRGFASADPLAVETGSDVSLDVDEIAVPVWTGSEYGVVWSGGPDVGVVLTRLDPTGASIGTTGISTEASHVTVAAAWTGSEYAVAWENPGDGDPCGVHVALVGPGDPAPRESMQVTGCDTGTSDQGLAWTGSELGLLWRSWTDGHVLTRLRVCD